MEMHMLTRRRPVMIRPHCIGESIDLHVHVLSLLVLSYKRPWFEMLRKAGHRLAKIHAHCIAILNEERDITEFMLGNSP